MYSSGGIDIVSLICTILFFIIVVALCCGDDKSSSSSSRTPKRNTSQGNSYSRSGYSECPQCGAPYYDGYCDECGYPDINQGWLGENF